MLDNLTDLFAALAVGVAAVAGACAAVWVFRRKQRSYIAWMKQVVVQGVHTDRALLIVGTALFLVLYAISILVQDLTDHLVDSEYASSIAPLRWTRELLGSEGSHRLAALMSVGRESYELRGLGREVFGNEVLMDMVRTQLGIRESPADPRNQFIELARSAGTLPVPKDRRQAEVELQAAKGVVSTLYYRAKNWLLGHPVYSIEMNGLQRRIDITRSMFLVACGSLMLLVVLLLGACLRAGVPLSGRQLGQRLLRRPVRKNPRRRPFLRRRLRIYGLRSLRPALVLVSIAVLCVVAYARAENNFNERAFGYYSSHVHDTTFGPGRPEDR